jgi:hypothetical protein
MRSGSVRSEQNSREQPLLLTTASFWWPGHSIARSDRVRPKSAELSFWLGATAASQGQLMPVALKPTSLRSLPKTQLRQEHC